MSGEPARIAATLITAITIVILGFLIAGAIRRGQFLAAGFCPAAGDIDWVKCRANAEAKP